MDAASGSSAAPRMQTRSTRMYQAGEAVAYKTGGRGCWQTASVAAGPREESTRPLPPFPFSLANLKVRNIIMCLRLYTTTSLFPLVGLIMDFRNFYQSFQRIAQ